MAHPQGPASAAFSRSQQPWAPDPPSRPPFTVVASLGKGHGTGSVATGTAVGVGEGSEARGGVGGPHVAAARAGLHLRSTRPAPSTQC